MAQPLFFEPNLKFEKVAAEVMLPEDPNAWPNELMQELFKQVPYVADFEPHVTMDRVDAERGYGFGHVEIQNKTEIQHGTPPEQAQNAGLKNARIPVIIRDRKLQPLDLLVTEDSKVLPLTEARLRGALFRPQVFDITGRGPGDMSMIGQLYPPYRQNYGFGGGGASMSAGMGKDGSAGKDAPGSWSHYADHMNSLLGPYGDQGMPQADAMKHTRAYDKKHKTQFAEHPGIKEGSAGLCDAKQAWARFDGMKKKGSVLAAIIPTLNQSDYNAFLDKLAHDSSLQAAYAMNAAVVPALEALKSYQPLSPAKIAFVTMQSLKPSVAQLRKEAEGYSVKTASHTCWLPEVKSMNRGEVVHLFGPKTVLAADETGAVTMATGPAEKEQENPEQDKPELVSQFGIYKVQDDQGRHLIGYVFPNLIDIDGTALPISLFTNGSQRAVQGDIVGVNVGGGASLFEGPPSGTGCFYQLLSNGRAQATVPFTIKASMDSPGEGATVLHGETFDGAPVQISVQPNIQAITNVDGRVLIPDSFSWLPLDKAEETQLLENPEGWGKEEEAKQALASVALRAFEGGTFAVDGLPVEKLAHDEKSFLSLDDTMFLLGALGVDLGYAQQKIGEAAAWNAPVVVRVGRYIKTASDVANDVHQKVASKFVILDEMLPYLKKDLSKEAAVIPDPTAVDTVLSLGFLNPENLGAFLSYLPCIDEAQGKMCELLLASRLGMREIPTGALERAIRSTEESLEGLKVLAFSKE